MFHHPQAHVKTSPAKSLSLHKGLSIISRDCSYGVQLLCVPCQCPTALRCLRVAFIDATNREREREKESQREREIPERALDHGLLLGVERKQTVN